ncbi:MAG: aldehyde dehydrogenase family protein [Actinomycetota bacterium]|nr:aldehyde dehydrogenase family protein [Actinomycetota bacterium]
MNAGTLSRGDWAALRLPIAGSRVVVARGDEVEDLDPTTQEVVARLRTSIPADVAEAVGRAEAAFKTTSWRSDGRLRSQVLWRFAERLRTNVEPLAELLTREQGKTIGEARSEISGSADMVEYYAGLARSLYGRSAVLGEHVHGVVVREPVGVVAVITPWNWPLTLLMRSLAPALAAGNTCVVKPASLTPAITVRALDLLAEDGTLPDGVVTCVLGPGSVVGDALVGAPGVEMIAFTGESGTGTAVMQRAALGTRKVALELGGKSPNIVFADANLEKALDGAMNAIFTTSGQICTAGSRLLLESSIYESFVARLVERVATLQMGDPLLATTTLAPLVSADQRRTVEDYIALGRKEGTVLTGGEPPSEEYLARGYFVPATVIVDLPLTSAVVREEIFGPVLTVHPFAAEGEAVALAEDTDFGLAAGIWTSDLDRAWRVGRAVRSGTVWINTYHHFYPEAEVGGFRRSGLGRQQGIEGLLEFTETKHLNFDAKPTLW